MSANEGLRLEQDGWLTNRMMRRIQLVTATHVGLVKAICIQEAQLLLT